MAVFERVLLATDFSEASERARDLAVAIARESGAELHVVHVCEALVYGDFVPSIDIVTPLTEVAEAKLAELMGSLRRACPGARGVLKMGSAWEQILAAGAEVRANVIVLGTHGRRGAAHALMGSVAERVVRMSGIPVLTVRSRPAAKQRETSG